MSDKIILVVAPSGQAGGGMGRVKDYILAFNNDPVPGFTFQEGVTRDDGGFVRSIMNTALLICRIWRLQLGGRLAAVHVNLGDNYSAVRKGMLTILSRLSGAKVLVHFHGVILDAQWRHAGSIMRWLIGVPFRAASTNIVLGKIWQRWLVEDLGVSPDRVAVVANGVPVPDYGGRDHLAPRPQVEIVFIGNLLKRKGVNDLIAAAAELKDTSRPWRLTFAGGGDIAGYQEKTRALGLIDRVHFVGWIDSPKIADMLANADIMVLPSYHEGLPLVILEAVGAGTPVICTPVGAIPEFLKDGETVLFVEPGDVQGLAAALKRLILDPSMRQALGDAGYLEYEAVFSLAAFRQSILNIYQSQLALPVS
jgi:glycosyltransferase involved in cell wall biosynthesis